MCSYITGCEPIYIWACCAVGIIIRRISALVIHGKNVLEHIIEVHQRALKHNGGVLNDPCGMPAFFRYMKSNRQIYLQIVHSDKKMQSFSTAAVLIADK